MRKRLVLGRRVKESFVIDPEGLGIVVTVVQTRGRFVKLVVEADESVSIARSELLERAKVGLGGK